MKLLFLLATCSLTWAQPDEIINSFQKDTPGTTNETLVRWWYGDAATATSITFDPSQNAGTGNGSGALKVVLNYTETGNQLVMLRDLSPPINVNAYQTLEMDVHFDPASARDASNGFGRFSLGFWDKNYEQILALAGNIPESAGEGWFHISALIPAGQQSLNEANGLILGMSAGEARGPATFWIDNIVLKGDENLPTPVLNLTPEHGQNGLRLITATQDIYDRQAIRTVGSDNSWVGRTAPVSYSLTISEYPDATDYPVVMYLVPVAADRATPPGTRPDWVEPHCVVVTIIRWDDGSARMWLRYKVDAPDSDGQSSHEYWVPDDGIHGGEIGTVGSDTVLGTWKVTFQPNGQIVLTPPVGNMATAQFSTANESKFAGPMYCYAGVLAADLRNKGRAVTFSQVSFTGLPTSITENFQTKELDSAIWALSGVNAGSGVPIFPIVASEHPMWLSWSLPDPYFTPECSPALDSEWTGLVGVRGYDFGGKRYKLVNRSSLPFSDISKAFFRLKKP